MASRRQVVRSYQRLFSPERRIYSIDGRTLPIPGGVPLRWLAHAAAFVVAALVLAGLHPAIIAAGGWMAYLSAARLGRRRQGLVLAPISAVVLTVAGLIVGLVDWPLRLVVLPAIGATVLTQIAPDGRGMLRHLLSLGRVRVAGRRRLGVALPEPARPRQVAMCVAVASDQHRPVLGRARITGPCRLVFADPVLVRRGRRGIRLVPVAVERRRRGVMVDALHVAPGERVEVRP